LLAEIGGLMGLIVGLNMLDMLVFGTRLLKNIQVRIVW